MSRPLKNGVDYFPHYCRHGNTLFILQAKFKNDGYAFWFKLLELLAASEPHIIDISVPEKWEYLLAYTMVESETAATILSILANLGQVDAGLLKERKIYSQNLMDKLSRVYEKRKREPEFPAQKPGLSAQKPGFSEPECTNMGVSGTETGVFGHKGSKVKEVNKEKKLNKEKKRADALDSSRSRNNEESKLIDDIVANLNSVLGTKYLPTSKAIRSMISARLREGHTFEDFKKVHESKTREWKPDPKMRKYLRPATLYCASKFAGYVNQIEAPIGESAQTDDGYVEYKGRMVSPEVRASLIQQDRKEAELKSIQRPSAEELAAIRANFKPIPGLEGEGPRG